MSVNREDVKKLKKIFRSNSHGLRILSKIYHGYRPFQIAELLHLSGQNVNYYTSILIDLRLIEKTGDRRGVSWKVTESGLFILKQFITQGVKRTKFPIRLHNVCFSFPITSSLEYVRIDWTEMKNNVFRHTMTGKQEKEYTVDLVKSPNEGNSRMLIHMHKVFTFDSYQEIIRLYEAARTAAVLTALELRIDISIAGRLVTKPHLAFEGDPIALCVATFETASTNTENNKGNAWIDASHEFGELETDDPEYAYKYLMMPENVYENTNQLDIIRKKLTGYKVHYDPLVTDNN